MIRLATAAFEKLISNASALIKEGIYTVLLRVLALSTLIAKVPRASG